MHKNNIVRLSFLVGVDEDFLEAQRSVELQLEQEKRDLEVARRLQQEMDQEQRFYSPRMYIIDRLQSY